jgi:DNA repair protein RecO
VSRHESLALVLRRWPYSENSQLVHLLTPDVGVVPALAKGVHRLQSGRAGVLDTHALVKVGYTVHEDRDLRTLTHAELLDRFSSISRNIDALNAAALLAELAELAAPPDSPSSKPFLFLVSALQDLDRGGDGPSFLVPRLFEALALLGLSPDLGPTVLTSPAWFSISAGRLLDPSESRPDGATMRISPLLHQALQEASHGPFSVEGSGQSQADDCLTMLGQFLGYHLERPPRAWQAIEERRSAARATR